MPGFELCEGAIGIEFCSMILPPELLEMWGRLLCMSAIQGPAMLYCPFKECSAPVLVDDGIAVTKSKCPHFSRLLRAHCKAPWHSGISCEEFQKLRVEDREREDIMLLKLSKNKKWQRCRNCGQVVERIDGCLFIKCRFSFILVCNCSSSFAEGLYGEIPSVALQSGNHFITKNKTTADQLQVTQGYPNT